MGQLAVFSVLVIPFGQIDAVLLRDIVKLFQRTEEALFRLEMTVEACELLLGILPDGFLGKVMFRVQHREQFGVLVLKRQYRKKIEDRQGERSQYNQDLGHPGTRHPPPEMPLDSIEICFC